MNERRGFSGTARAVGAAVVLLAACGGARAGEAMTCRDGAPALAVIAGTGTDDEGGTHGYVCREWFVAAEPAASPRDPAWIGPISGDPERDTYGLVARSPAYAAAEAK